MRFLSSSIFAATALALASMTSSAQESVLEHYVLASGGTLAGSGGTVSAFIEDESFGGGDAHASVFLDTTEDATLLHLRVHRYVPPETISFALLVFGIEVHGYRADGTEVYTREPPVFSFGDSSSGNWTRRLKMPRSVTRVEARFVGNYE